MVTIDAKILGEAFRAAAAAQTAYVGVDLQGRAFSVGYAGVQNAEGSRTIAATLNAIAAVFERVAAEEVAVKKPAAKKVAAKKVGGKK